MDGPIDAREAGERLRAARDDRGLSQTDAAARLGVARPRLAEWEAGRHVPDWPKLVWMVATLGYDPAILIPELFNRPTTGRRPRLRRPVPPAHGGPLGTPPPPGPS